MTNYLSREVRDEQDRKIRATATQHEGKLRAKVVVEVRGRRRFGKSLLKEYAFSIDLPRGSDSEVYLVRHLRDALLDTFIADESIARRAALLTKVARRSSQAPSVAVEKKP